MTRPNVLLIVLDSVRAQNTPFVPDGAATMPEIERFATDATVYTNARAPSNWSLPSHVSLFTGTPPVEHGVHSTTDRLRPGQTIFEDLSAAGYSTAAFSDNAFLTTTNNGLKDCFDHVPPVQNVPHPMALNPAAFVFRNGEGHYDQFLREALTHEFPLRSLHNGIETKLKRSVPWLPFVGTTVHTPGQVYVDQFLEWSRDLDRPWAACLNLMDAHTPYEPASLVDADSTLAQLRDEIDDYVWDFYTGAQPWWLLTALEALYNDSIRQADAAIGLLLDALMDRGDLDETLIVLTSDHGEGFGESSETGHGTRIAGHGIGLNEEVLHVPLVVRYPGHRTAATNTSLASLLQFPTVVESVLAADETPASFVSSSPVLASTHFKGSSMVRDESFQHLDSTLLRDDLYAVYEERDGAIRKLLCHGAAAWQVAQTSVASDTQAATPEAARLATQLVELHQSRPALCDHRDGAIEYDEATLDRLADLGYVS